MKFLKFLLFITFIFLLAVFETSWQVIPDTVNIVFIFVVINLLKDRYNKKSLYAWTSVLIGGVFLDFYSLLPDGLYFITFIILAFILYQVLLSAFSISSHFHVLVVSFVASLVFKITIYLLNKLFYYIGFSTSLMSFSLIHLISFMILNSLLIFLFYGWHIRYTIKK